MTSAAVILAAGASRRMGRPKALLDWNSRTFLDLLIHDTSPFCHPVIAVLGHAAAQIESAIEPHPALIVVRNPEPERGQFSSLQVGLEQVPVGAGGVLLALVDHPCVDPKTIQLLLQPRGAKVVIPQWNGRHGHPIWFRGDLIAEFLASPATCTAQDILRAHRNETVYLSVDDPGILRDIDDPAAYLEARARSMAG